MIAVNCEYAIRDDVGFLLETEKMNIAELAEKTKISRTTLVEIAKKGRTTDSVYEKFYAYAYENRYRINAVKEEIAKETHKKVLFHGSKKGLQTISAAGSKDNCDFGKGFYLGETYHQALAFVCENEKSSVYSFRYSLEGLRIKTFEVSFEWMLAICYYRGTLREYAQSEMVQKLVSEVEAADVIIAPIADNRMFYIMAQFTDGEINSEVALHSLSASKLGLQYVFRTEKALNQLQAIEKYYLCAPEREDCKAFLNERCFAIDTKLKLAKREFKTGLYIEELLQ